LIFEDGSAWRLVFEAPLLARRRIVEGRVGCGFWERKIEECVEERRVVRRERN
jgi:hypothetical protein